MVDLTERKESHEEMMWRHRSWSSRRASVIRRKDKERDNKKKEYRDEAFDGKGKKGKKQKQVAEVKKTAAEQERRKKRKIKQIVIPEVLTIKELADKMKDCSFCYREKTVPSGKSCNSKSGNRL